MLPFFYENTRHTREKASLLYFSLLLANSRPQKQKKVAVLMGQAKEETKRHVPEQRQPFFFFPKAFSIIIALLDA